jgi:hypothetical protein
VTRVLHSYEEWKRKPFQIRAEDLFRDMPLEVWIEDWCSIKDELSGEMVPFRLYAERQWRGKRSPGQRDLCRWIDRTRIGFGAKGRQLGWSEIFGKYVGKIFVSERRAEISIFSMNEEEATHFMRRRVKEPLKALPNLVDEQGNPLVIWPKMDLEGSFKIESPITKGGIGTMATVMSSNPDAGSGRTNRLTLLDEAEKIPFAAENWTAVVPTIDKNPRGQLFSISSGQKSGTWYKKKLQTIYNNIRDGKPEPVSLFFMPWHADPSRDQAWYDGQPYDNDVDRKAANPDTIEELFLSKQGKVFPHFEDLNGGRHVWDFEEKLGPGRLAGMDLYAAYDPGFVHPAVFLLAFYDRYQDMLYVFDEIYVKQKEIGEVGVLVKAKMDSLPYQIKTALADTALFKRGGVGGKTTEGDVLNRVTGIRFKGAKKADAAGSRELLSRRLSDKKIVFHPHNCPNTIRQMRDWCFNDKGEPVDVEDDCIDDVRYICAEVWPDKKAEPAPPREAYNPHDQKYNPHGQGRLLRRVFERQAGQTLSGSDREWMRY